MLLVLDEVPNENVAVCIPLRSATFPVANAEGMNVS